MSGIVGLVSMDGPPQKLECLPTLIQPILSPTHTTSITWTTHCFGLGISVPQSGASVTMAKNGAVLLAVAGYIANDDHFKHLLTQLPHLDQPRTLSEQLIELYLLRGKHVLQELNGQYAIVIWEEETQTLIIINDRYGLQPFYYWHGARQLVFSTSLKAVARHPDFDRQINHTALFDLIATGQMLGERTLLRDVYTLPPATVLTYTNRQLKMERYWLPKLYQPGEYTIPLAICAEQMGELIQDAVCKHTNPDACLLLTGGLDSRWLAGSLVTQYGSENLLANTIGHDRAKDTRLSRQIAQTIGLRYQVIPVNPNYLEEYSQECVRRTEGNMNVTAGWILSETAFLKNSGIRQVVTGVGAELISGRHWLAEQEYHDPAQAIYHMCNDHWQFERAAMYMRAPYRQEVLAESTKLVEDSLRSAPSEDAYSRYDYLHLTQHRRHPTGNILFEDASVREPFFDNALVDFAFQLPPKTRATIYKKALAQTYPRLAEIETTEFGVSVLDDLDKKKNYGQEMEKLLFRTARKLRLASAAGLPEGDAPWNTIYPNHWMRTTSKDYIAHFAKKVHILEPWVDSRAVQGLIDDHLNGRTHNYAMIGAFITAVLWLEQTT